MRTALQNHRDRMRRHGQTRTFDYTVSYQTGSSVKTVVIKWPRDITMAEAQRMIRHTIDPEAVVTSVAWGTNGR